MDIRLYQLGVGLISIPLKKTGMFPNFLVIEQQYGCHRAKQINFTTGEVEVMDCATANYKLVLREVLEPNEKYPEEGTRESVLFPLEPISLPIDLIPAIVTHQRVKANLQVVNALLSLFSFRGALSEFSLEVDEDVLDEILADIAAKEAAIALAEQQRLAALEAQNNPEPQPE